LTNATLHVVPVNMFTKIYYKIVISCKMWCKRPLTMLNRFHAMKRINAHTSLPQSECVSEEGFEQRGYAMALDILIQWK
jgi:hypothetical protein